MTIMDKQQTKYNTLFFDVDGTLSDSHLGITRSAQYALKTAGLIIDDESTLKHFIGPPLELTLTRDYHFSEEKSVELIKKFREYYATKGYLEHTVFAGIPEMIRALSNHGIPMAVATTKPTKYAKIILEQYGILDCFKIVSGSAPDHPRLYKTDILKYAMEMMDVNPGDSAVMIGDREHDISAAHNCKIESIGVLYGYGDLAEMEACKPTYIAKTVNELRDLLNLHI